MDGFTIKSQPNNMVKLKFFTSLIENKEKNFVNFDIQIIDCEVGQILRDKECLECKKGTYTL